MRSCLHLAQVTKSPRAPEEHGWRSTGRARTDGEWCDWVCDGNREKNFRGACVVMSKWTVNRLKFYHGTLGVCMQTSSRLFTLTKLPGPRWRKHPGQHHHHHHHHHHGKLDKAPLLQVFIGPVQTQGYLVSTANKNITYNNGKIVFVCFCLL